jgi:hypothetical protein
MGPDVHGFPRLRKGGNAHLAETRWYLDIAAGIMRLGAPTLSHTPSHIEKS